MDAWSKYLFLATLAVKKLTAVDTKSKNHPLADLAVKKYKPQGTQRVKNLFLANLAVNYGNRNTKEEGILIQKVYEKSR